MKDIRCMDIPIPCRLFDAFVPNNDEDAAQEVVPVGKLFIMDPWVALMISSSIPSMAIDPFAACLCFRMCFRSFNLLFHSIFNVFSMSEIVLIFVPASPCTPLSQVSMYYLLAVTYLDSSRIYHPRHSRCHTSNLQWLCPQVGLFSFHLPMHCWISHVEISSLGPCNLQLAAWTRYADSRDTLELACLFLSYSIHASNQTGGHRPFLGAATVLPLDPTTFFLLLKFRSIGFARWLR
jgi:hypothetical protein